jgi:hypothetical protein
MSTADWAKKASNEMAELDMLLKDVQSDQATVERQMANKDKEKFADEQRKAREEHDAEMQKRDLATRRAIASLAAGGKVTPVQIYKTAAQVREQKIDNYRQMEGRINKQLEEIAQIEKKTMTGDDAKGQALIKNIGHSLHSLGAGDPKLKEMYDDLVSHANNKIDVDWASDDYEGAHKKIDKMREYVINKAKSMDDNIAEVRRGLANIAGQSSPTKSEAPAKTKHVHNGKEYWVRKDAQGRIIETLGAVE